MLRLANGCPFIKLCFVEVHSHSVNGVAPEKRVRDPRLSTTFAYVAIDLNDPFAQRTDVYRPVELDVKGAFW